MWRTTFFYIVGMFATSVASAKAVPEHDGDLPVIGSAECDGAIAEDELAGVTIQPSNGNVGRMQATLIAAKKEHFKAQSLCRGPLVAYTKGEHGPKGYCGYHNARYCYEIHGDEYTDDGDVKRIGRYIDGVRFEDPRRTVPTDHNQWSLRGGHTGQRIFLPTRVDRCDEELGECKEDRNVVVASYKDYCDESSGQWDEGTRSCADDDSVPVVAGAKSAVSQTGGATSNVDADLMSAALNQAGRDLRQAQLRLDSVEAGMLVCNADPNKRIEMKDGVPMCVSVVAGDRVWLLLPLLGICGYIGFLWWHIQRLQRQLYDAKGEARHIATAMNNMEEGLKAQIQRLQLSISQAKQMLGAVNGETIADLVGDVRTAILHACGTPQDRMESAVIVDEVKAMAARWVASDLIFEGRIKTRQSSFENIEAQNAALSQQVVDARKDVGATSEESIREALERQHNWYEGIIQERNEENAALTTQIDEARSAVGATAKESIPQAVERLNARFLEALDIAGKSTERIRNELKACDQDMQNLCRTLEINLELIGSFIKASRSSKREPALEALDYILKTVQSLEMVRPS